MLDLHGYGWQLMAGLSMTVRASLLAMAIAMVLGLIGAWAKLAGPRPVQAAAQAYTTVIRGVPELVLLLLIYFGGTILLQRLVGLLSPGTYAEVNAFAAGVFTIGFVYGAFATEVFRGAILAVPKGQIEAAKACGMDRLLIGRRILLPQMWRFALPGLGNVWLVLLKSSALMSVVGLDELTRKAFIAAGATFKPFTFYLAAALIYLGLTIVSTLALDFMERRASRGVRRASAQ